MMYTKIAQKLVWARILKYMAEHALNFIENLKLKNKERLINEFKTYMELGSKLESVLTELLIQAFEESSNNWGE